MTKQRAILILKDFIRYKERCISVIDADSFSSDLEYVRQGLVKLTQSDHEVLEMILKELHPGK